MDAKQTVFRVISRVSGSDPSRIEPGLDLVADLGIDSPRALQLLVELEEELGVEISDEEAAALNTVGDILDWLARLGRG